MEIPTESDVWRWEGKKVEEGEEEEQAPLEGWMGGEGE